MKVGKGRSQVKLHYICFSTLEQEEIGGELHADDDGITSIGDLVHNPELFTKLEAHQTVVLNAIGEKSRTHKRRMYIKQPRRTKAIQTAGRRFVIESIPVT